MKNADNRPLNPVVPQFEYADMKIRRLQLEPRPVLRYLAELAENVASECIVLVQRKVNLQLFRYLVELGASLNPPG